MKIHIVQNFANIFISFFIICDFPLTQIMLLTLVFDIFVWCQQITAFVQFEENFDVARFSRFFLLFGQFTFQSILPLWHLLGNTVMLPQRKDRGVEKGNHKTRWSNTKTLKHVFCLFKSSRENHWQVVDGLVMKYWFQSLLWHS